MPIKGKNILFGITAGIAAYKAAFVVRELIKKGAKVKVIMTPDASAFVTPLTLATLSENPVHCDFFDSKTGTWTNHVELGMWADLMLIAPLTANTLAKMASGICDNLLLASYLSAKCSVMFAPAMDLDMYAHSTTQSNIKKLCDRNNLLIKPGTGSLASGLSGEGRMAEVDEIVFSVEAFFDHHLPLKGKKALITAGPTFEKIDSVRYIGNFSSGKMGFALAYAFAELGAETILISGPTHQELKNYSIELIPVTSAEEMFEACKQIHQEQDYLVMAAAVADFKPKTLGNKKIKKEENNFNQILLEPTQDILKYLGQHKPKGQTLVGFALEDWNEVEHAKNKIKNKNLDFIVLNSLNDKGAGFGTDTNKVTLIDKNFALKELPLEDKYTIAKQIVNQIILTL